MKQDVLIKGVPQKNMIALIVIIIGIAVSMFSVIMTIYEYYENFWMFYDNILQFFINECFRGIGFGGFLYYGYVLLLGILILVVGFVLKIVTEKCEITITNDNISGKFPNKKSIDIPVNQITAVERSAFSGVYIAYMSKSYCFRCFKNREEILKAITSLLNACSVSSVISTPIVAFELGGEVERLEILKDLLDSNVITQEEFDIKKHQILSR